MNKIILLGNLTKDLDQRWGKKDGKDFCIVSGTIAVRKRYKPKDGPDSDFFNFTAFGATAENMTRFFAKGSRICIEGELSNNNYEDKNGVKRYEQKIIVHSFDFASSRKEEPSAAPAPETDADGFMAISPDLENTLPFTLD